MCTVKKGETKVLGLLDVTLNGRMALILRTCMFSLMFELVPSCVSPSSSSLVASFILLARVHCARKVHIPGLSLPNVMFCGFLDFTFNL